MPSWNSWLGGQEQHLEVPGHPSRVFWEYSTTNLPIYQGEFLKFHWKPGDGIVGMVMGMWGCSRGIPGTFQGYSRPIPGPFQAPAWTLPVGIQLLHPFADGSKVWDWRFPTLPEPGQDLLSRNVLLSPLSPFLMEFQGAE